MNATVKDVMTAEVVTVRRDTSFKEMAATLRRREKVRHEREREGYDRPVSDTQQTLSDDELIHAVERQWQVSSCAAQ